MKSKSLHPPRIACIDKICSDWCSVGSRPRETSAKNGQRSNHEADPERRWFGKPRSFFSIRRPAQNPLKGDRSRSSYQQDCPPKSRLRPCTLRPNPRLTRQTPCRSISQIPKLGVALSCRDRLPKPQSVVGQNVQCEKEEQQHPLEGLDRGGGDLQDDLCQFTADIGQRHQKPR